MSFKVLAFTLLLLVCSVLYTTGRPGRGRGRGRDWGRGGGGGRGWGRSRGRNNHWFRAQVDNQDQHTRIGEQPTIAEPRVTATLPVHQPTVSKQPAIEGPVTSVQPVITEPPITAHQSVTAEEVAVPQQSTISDQQLVGNREQTVTEGNSSFTQEPALLIPEVRTIITHCFDKRRDSSVNFSVNAGLIIY